MAAKDTTQRTPIAEASKIQFKTSSLDGKKQALTWYYYAIPIAKYLKNEEQKKD